MVIHDVDYNNIRKALRSVQKELDKVSSKICTQINGIVVDLDRLEKKESEKNVPSKNKK